MAKNDNVCPDCGQVIEIGMFPFCKGNKEDHLQFRNRYAQPFEPTVYFVNEAGEVRFPANDDARPPKGYEKREITNLREADHFMKEINNREDAKAQEAKYNEYRYWNEVHKYNANELKHAAESFENPGCREMADIAIQKMRNYEYKKADDCNFHIAPFVYDGVRVKDE